jgi:hypothetical protein
VALRVLWDGVVEEVNGIFDLRKINEGLESKIRERAHTADLWSISLVSHFLHGGATCLGRRRIGRLVGLLALRTLSSLLASLRFRGGGAAASRDCLGCEKVGNLYKHNEFEI